MTEQQWQSWTWSKELLYFVQLSTSRRKLGLFHTACCRVVTEGWEPNHPVCKFLADVEGILEGHISGEAVTACLTGLDRWTRDGAQLVMDLLNETRGKLRANVQEVARETAAALLLMPVADPRDEWWTITSQIDDELLSRHYALTEGHREQVCNQNIHLLRDIFGNPFRPVTFSPAWRTDTAVSLARGMYESRDFGAMPILADALQDAGCDNDEVLNHCRDAKQVHVRGCWVVDLVLGKA
jgi:hypothetical protein